MDVFKILKDLELKAVGLDPVTNKMQEGYFASFRPIGLPISAEDFFNPWSPTGSSLDAPTTKPAPTDPKNANSPTLTVSLTEIKVEVASIAKSEKNYLNTYMLIDSKLQMNNEWSVIPSSSKISDTWFAIITGANGIPKVTGLNPAIQHAYDQAYAKLQNADGTITPHYTIYNAYEEAYNKEVSNFQKAYAACFTNPMLLELWPNSSILYQNSIDKAMKAWKNLGFKKEIEDAYNIISAQGSDPTMALINRAKDRFTNSLNNFVNIGELPYTMLLPSTWYDKDNNDGWNTYTTYDFHSENHYQESDTSYSGGGGFSLGFWSVGGGFNSSSAQSSLNIQTNNLEISFSYCIVDVVRPWLDTTLLNMHNWFLMGDYKKDCISDGTMGQKVDGKVEPLFLPSIVTNLILVKNISIKWDNWEADWENAQSSMSAEMSVGFGPFSVHGSYKHHEERRDFKSDASGESLIIDGIQVIGYISAINPPSPHFDSSQFVTISDAQ